MTVAVQKHELLVRRRHEAVFVERPRVGIVVRLRNLFRAVRIVGSEARIDDRHVTVMLRQSVPWREGADDFSPVGVWNRLRTEHTCARRLVPVEDHLTRPVLTHRPEVVIVRLRTIDVFPAHIDNLTVRQRPRRVVLLDVARERAQRPVGEPFVERSHLRQPAFDVAFRARRAEDDRIVGEPRRLVVVPAGLREVARGAHRRGGDAYLVRFRRRRAGRKLALAVFPLAREPRQPRSVRLNRVETEMVFALRKIGKQKRLAVVMNLRIADIALGVFEDHARLARLDVERVERAPGA